MYVPAIHSILVNIHGMEMETIMKYSHTFY